MPYKSFASGGGYRWLDVWVMANIIQIATQKFCRRFLDRSNDPCGRLFDQMTQAARSGVSNIAEGYARNATSRETEMKLYDVAKASLDELSGDYRNWLMLDGELPWHDDDAETKAILAVKLDRADYTTDIERSAVAHILAQEAKFAYWLDAEDSFVRARALLVLCGRAIQMLTRKIEQSHADFVEEGGFAENLTRDRLAARDATHAQNGSAPKCPKCGKPMRERVAKRGTRAGKRFWSCVGYPECDGTRPLD